MEKHFDGTRGDDGEGGEGYLQLGVGGRSYVDNGDGVFRGGGGAQGIEGGAGGGGRYSRGVPGDDVSHSEFQPI